MYKVTSNQCNFISLDDKQEAERLADMIKGTIYVFFKSRYIRIYQYWEPNII